MADNNVKVVVTAEDKTSPALASVTRGLGQMQAQAVAASAALSAIGVTFSAAAAVTLVKGTIDAADGFNDLSQRIGITVKDLAGWQLAANQSGTSIESVAKGVKSLSTYMVQHSDKLREAGITATDANGALIQLADVFAGMDDGIEKTALAVQLFGKAGLEMIPMLNMGSKGLAEAQEKAAEFGRRMAELAPQADRFNDLMTEMAFQSKVFGINVATAVVPSMIRFVEQLQEGKSIAGGWGSAIFEFGVLLDPTQGLPHNIDLTRQALEKLHDEMARGREQNLADGGSIDLSGVESRIGLMDRRKRFLESMQRQKVMDGAAKLGDYRDARDRMLSDSPTLERARKMLDRSSDASGSKGKTPLQRMIERGEANLASSIDSEEEMSAVAAKRAISSAQAAARESEAANKAAKQEAESTERLRQHYIGIADPLQKYRTQLDEVNRLREAGLLTADQAIAAEWEIGLQMDEAAKKMIGFKDDAKDVFADLKYAVEGWGRDFTNTLADAFMTGKLNLTDMSNSIARDLIRIQIQRSITDRLVKSGSAFLSSLFPTFHAGGIVGAESAGSRFVSPMAFAGAPRFHAGGIVGDEVPAILKKGEGVFTAEQMRALGGGSGSTLTINAPIYAPGADASVVPQINAALAALESRIYRNVPGVVRAAATKRARVSPI